MELENRRDQFSYFLGFAARKSARQLMEAIQNNVDSGHSSDPEDAFEHCPFNDSQKQILRAVQIYENSTKTSLVKNLQSLVDEFLFLASNFEPPCCGDGRSFYCQTSHKQICLECDRCGKTYDLTGQPIKAVGHRKMTQVDFLSTFEKSTASQWPYYEKVRSLCVRSAGSGT
ncbi:MAG: hypothetical protein GY943_24625 [Chloroflexi bacterium]|nr:hypothetical protein [Chloroflexota bacterium]